MRNDCTEKRFDPLDAHPTRELDECRSLDEGEHLEDLAGRFFVVGGIEEPVIVTVSEAEQAPIPTRELDEHQETGEWLSYEELRSLWAERGFELFRSRRSVSCGSRATSQESTTLYASWFTVAAPTGQTQIKVKIYLEHLISSARGLA